MLPGISRHWNQDEEPASDPLMDLQGEIGPDLFRHACLMGWEVLVSKHRESSYLVGRFDCWVR